MQPGDSVRVRAYGGEQLVRRVVGVKGEVVLICRDEEFLAAAKEGREPVSVGFKVKDVVAVLKTS